MTTREDEFRCDWKSWCVRIEGHYGECEPATPSRLYEPRTPPDSALVLAVSCGRCKASANVRCVGSINEPVAFHYARFVLSSKQPKDIDADTPLIPGEPPAKCKTCGGERKLLHFYSRGPGDPPGNAMGPCPDCTPSLPREPEATPIIVHAFMNRKEPLCEHDYSMFRENESVVSTDSLAVNCKTCLEIRDATREPEAKVCGNCDGSGWLGDQFTPPVGCNVCNGTGRLPLNPRAR